MELVIAVILGVILLIKVGSDKSASAEYDKRVDEKKERSKAFENKYTSQELETMLRGYISSEANYNSVCNEDDNFALPSISRRTINVSKTTTFKLFLLSSSTIPLRCDK